MLSRKNIREQGQTNFLTSYTGVCWFSVKFASFYCKFRDDAPRFDDGFLSIIYRALYVFLVRNWHICSKFISSQTVRQLPGYAYPSYLPMHHYDSLFIEWSDTYLHSFMYYLSIFDLSWKLDYRVCVFLMQFKNWNRIWTVYYVIWRGTIWILGT